MSIFSTDEGSEPCVPMSLEDEILDPGALDRQKSGGVLDGKGVLDRQESGGFSMAWCYTVSVSLRRWRGNAALVRWSSMMVLAGIQIWRGFRTPVEMEEWGIPLSPRCQSSSLEASWITTKRNYSIMRT